LGKNEQAIINKLIYAGLFETSQYLNENINHIHTLKPGNKYNSTSCIESNNKIILIKYVDFSSIYRISMKELLNGYKSMFDVVKNTKDIITVIVSKIENQIHLWKIEFDESIKASVVDHSIYKFV
jgi:hypothetical protein